MAYYALREILKTQNPKVIMLDAYGFHVYDFKGKQLIFTFIMVIMMIPTQVSAVGFIQLINKVKLNDTYWPLIIPAIAAPAVFFYMKQNIESTLPMEIIEAARVDGSNEFYTFNMISLPMLKPALAVQMIFAFVASWNNFFTPALVISSKSKATVPIMLSLLRSKMNSENGDLGEIYMFILLSIIPVVIVYMFLSKFIIKVVTMMKVTDTVHCPMAFEHPVLTNTIGEYISSKGLTQLRIAETEKYAHVTYFINGGSDVIFEGEKRILVPSPK